MSTREKYPILSWRPAWDILWCYIPVAGAIALAQYSIYFYPISLLIIANRLLALSLICHESMHGLLFRNKKLNEWVGRWLCAFPASVSYSKYRKLHILHHRGTGKAILDPDLHLYNVYPRRWTEHLKINLYNLLTLKTFWAFIQYYTELPELFRNPKQLLPRKNLPASNHDFFRFLFFNITLFAIFSYYGVLLESFLFWGLPMLLVTQPYVLLMGGLQHGPIPEGSSKSGLSRSVRGPKWLMEILLPLDINFHGEHHLDSTVPHYWLKQFAADLETDGVQIWKQSYSESLKDLFSEPQAKSKASAS